MLLVEINVEKNIEKKNSKIILSHPHLFPYRPLFTRP